MYPINCLRPKGHKESPRGAAFPRRSPIRGPLGPVSHPEGGDPGLPEVHSNLSKWRLHLGTMGVYEDYAWTLEPTSRIAKGPSRTSPLLRWTTALD